jgi:hypothetical protein
LTEGLCVRILTSFVGAIPLFSRIRIPHTLGTIGDMGGNVDVAAMNFELNRG